MENIKLAGVLGEILVAMVVRLFFPAMRFILNEYIFCQLFPEPISASLT